MGTSRIENAKRNIIWGIFEKIILLLLPFLTRTLLIKVLGKEYLGLNSVFSSILTVLSISELGFATAVVFSMYKPIAENDKATICAILSYYRKIYRIVGSVILVAGLCIVPFLKYIINADQIPSINIYILYFIFLFNTVIGYFLYAYKGVLFTAHQRSDLASKRTISINLCSNIITILSLLFVRNYYAYVIITPLTTITGNLASAFLAKKVYPELVCKGNISAERKREIAKKVKGLLSFKIYGVFFTSVDTIVISAFLGLVPLAIYNSYYYIQTSIIGFIAIFTNSITAGIGNKIASSSKEENYNDFKKVVFANAWLSSWCTVCLFCLYQPFIKIWLGADMLFPFDTMLIMVLYFLFSRISTITYTYREAAGLWWEDRFRPLVSAVVNLSLNLYLVRHIGMNGVILSTLFCTIFINIPWGSHILFKHYFKRSMREYFMKLVFYVAITAIVSIITYILINLIGEDGLGVFAVKCIICVVVPNALFWIIYRKMPEYCYFKELIAKHLKIKH